MMPTHYHMAPRSARDSIFQHGLDFTLGGGITDQFEDHEGGNYLFLYADGYPDEQWWSEEMGHRHGEPYDVWHVNADGLPLREDAIGAHYTVEPIPADRLSLRGAVKTELYLIQATAVVEHDDGSTHTQQLPTFLLDSSVQGIVSAEHAERIARDMIGSIMRPGSEINVCAIERNIPTDKA